MTHLKPAKEENLTMFTEEKFRNLGSTDISSLTFC